MSESIRMWVEVIFNVSYLIVVWGLTVAMLSRLGGVKKENRALAKRFIWAFALLALGDTGHVGFRVIAYALGGVEANPLLVGMGALSTAYTVTVFYMLMLDIWRIRYNKSLGILGISLLAVGVLRLVLMAFPQNNWPAIIPPYGWSLARNALLTIQGLGVLFLILRDSAAGEPKSADRPFRLVGLMIALSFLFYAPVILWSQAVPLLGMLMIPKTCAYLGVAFIAYREFFPKGDLRVTTPA